MPTSINLERTLDAAELGTLCEIPGPCVTLLLPPYRPGELASPDWVHIRQLIRTAAELPEVQYLGREANALFAPLLALVDQPELEKGGRGLAVFSAPAFTSAYRVDSISQHRLVVAARAFVKPLLAEALAPPDVFILGLSRKRLRLLRCRRGTCEETPLPVGVPESLAEALALDQPDHTLQNRSSAGSSTGTMGGVRFGTLSDREAEPEYMHHFFSLVDQGLRPLIQSSPLVLMGVAEEVAAFRKAARHSHLLDYNFNGREDILSLDEAAKHARKAALAFYRKEGEQVFRDFLEMNERHRTLNSVPEVVIAAEEGRIHQLVLAEDMELDAARTGPDALKGDDLLNAAAVETMKRSGRVFALPAERMGNGSPVAAILRY